MKPYLYQELIKYQNKNIYPFHMPGHKRNLENEIKNPYHIDITEIDGFDNLNDPQGIIKKSMEEASEFYGSKKTFYLVNGSTVGILSAISSVCRRGDKLLMARNCHKAVYHAVRILDLEPIYLPLIYIEEKKMFGGIDEEKLKEILEEHQDIKGVIVTSPTYEGIVINIKHIKMLINPHNIPLIVDEAHGAHFPFFDSFPKSAIYEGADIVIQSLHKTMPSFTQTALLHVCSEDVDVDYVQEWISMYQSSSPSYLLMAGIEYSIYYGIEEKQKFEEYYRNLIEYRKKITELQHISLLEEKDIKEYGGYALDIGKLVLFFHHTRWTGNEISDILLNQYQIQIEMSERDYIIAMSTVCDTKEGFERLYVALKELDQRISEQILQEMDFNDQNTTKKEASNYFISKKQEYKIKYRPYEALQRKKYKKCLQESIGSCSGAYVYLYPPGIPMLVPGEVIEEYHISLILEYKKDGFYVKGIEQDEENYKILILDEND